MTAMAPNSEHSHIVLKSSVSFSLKEKEVKPTQCKKLVPNSFAVHLLKFEILQTT
jgi:hypothetical protein